MFAAGYKTVETAAAAADAFQIRGFSAHSTQLDSWREGLFVATLVQVKILRSEVSVRDVIDSRSFQLNLTVWHICI
jgi:hypothetical protein